MSVAAELRAQRRQTAGFIAANAMQLELLPRIRTKTASGYSTTYGDPRPAQYFRLVDQSTTFLGNVPGRLRSSEGEQRKITHQLVGYWDAQVEVGDKWVDALGARYEVDEILPDNGYERRAKVIRYGPES